MRGKKEKGGGGEGGKKGHTRRCHSLMTCRWWCLWRGFVSSEHCSSRFFLLLQQWHGTSVCYTTDERPRTNIKINTQPYATAKKDHSKTRQSARARALTDALRLRGSQHYLPRLNPRGRLHCYQRESLLDLLPNLPRFVGLFVCLFHTRRRRHSRHRTLAVREAFSRVFRCPLTSIRRGPSCGA